MRNCPAEGGMEEWTPEWESLADALERATNGGTSRDVAKQRICTDIAQDQISLRPYVASDIPGKPPVLLSNRGSYRKPSFLVPGDFDWKNSRPMRPWPVNRTGSEYDWEEKDIKFLELKTDEVIDRLCRASDSATAAKIGEPSDSVASGGNNVALAQNAQQNPNHGRGALPKYDWKGARCEFFRLMDHHGNISIDAADDWTHQASVERAITTWFSNQELHPAESTIRGYVKKWLVEYWKSQKADK
jgi:hypothetical protein